METKALLYNLAHVTETCLNPCLSMSLDYVSVRFFHLKFHGSMITWVEMDHSVDFLVSRSEETSLGVELTRWRIIILEVGSFPTTVAVRLGNFQQSFPHSLTRCDKSPVVLEWGSGKDLF